MAFSTYIRSVHAWLRKRKYRCKENAQKAEFQIRKKKYSNRCFRKFDRKDAQIIFFSSLHLLVYRTKYCSFWKRAGSFVDKGDYTLIQQTGFLVRRIQSFTSCLTLTDWKSASYKSVCLHGRLELMWVYSSGSEININF